MIDPLTAFLYFGVPTTVGLLGLTAAWMHLRQHDRSGAAAADSLGDRAAATAAADRAPADASRAIDWAPAESITPNQPEATHVPPRAASPPLPAERLAAVVSQIDRLHAERLRQDAEVEANLRSLLQALETAPAGAGGPRR